MAIESKKDFKIGKPSVITTKSDPDFTPFTRIVVFPVFEDGKKVGALKLESEAACWKGKMGKHGMLRNPQPEQLITMCTLSVDHKGGKKDRYVAGFTKDGKPIEKK